MGISDNVHDFVKISFLRSSRDRQKMEEPTFSRTEKMSPFRIRKKIPTIERTQGNPHPPPPTSRRGKFTTPSAPLTSSLRRDRKLRFRTWHSSSRRVRGNRGNFPFHHFYSPNDVRNYSTTIQLCIHDCRQLPTESFRSKVSNVFKRKVCF